MNNTVGITVTHAKEKKGQREAPSQHSSLMNCFLQSDLDFSSNSCSVTQDFLRIWFNIAKCSCFWEGKQQLFLQYLQHVYTRNKKICRRERKKTPNAIKTMKKFKIIRRWMERGNIPSHTCGIVNDPDGPSRLPLAWLCSTVQWHARAGCPAAGDRDNRGKLSVDQSTWSWSSAPIPKSLQELSFKHLQNPEWARSLLVLGPSHLLMPCSTDALALLMLPLHNRLQFMRPPLTKKSR